MSKKTNKISGFPEFDSCTNIVMEKIKRQISETYEKFGYAPLDTRLVESSKIMLSKGIDGKEVYTLGRLNEESDKNMKKKKDRLALRFDLTVPLARHIAENMKNITFPYKRYQIAKVYRGETAREHHGRYREFYQSDIDVIGNGKLDMNYDAEFPVIINIIFRDIIGVERFVIRINNRKLLQGLFEYYGITDISKIKSCVKIIDDIEKVEIDETIEKLINIGKLSEMSSLKLIHFFNICQKLPPDEVIKHLNNLKFDTDKYSQLKTGIMELTTVINGILSSGVDKNRVMIDPSIARGLDYYTGTVYETNLLDYPELGSVCSGGRYADLVSTITGNKKHVYPGAGISIGLSRLVPVLIKHGAIKADKKVVTDVLMLVQNSNEINKFQNIRSILHENGFNADICFRITKLKKQLKYANSLNVPFCLFYFDNKLILKDMGTHGKQYNVDNQTLANILSQAIISKREHDIDENNVTKKRLNQNKSIPYNPDKLFESVFTRHSTRKIDINITKSEDRSNVTEYLDRFKDCSIVNWYIGCHGNYKNSETFYKLLLDNIVQHNKPYLLDLTAWNSFFFKGSSIYKNFNKAKHNILYSQNIIHTSDFFKTFVKNCKSGKKIDLYKNIFSRDALFKISEKFPDSSITISDVFKDCLDTALLEKLGIDPNKDTSKIYSVFQYIELLWIINNILTKDIQFQNTIVFILPNDELKYYPLTYLYDDICNYCDNIYWKCRINIKLYCFKYGDKLSDRPYNSK